ncbi:response regulator transcription factor [Malaciobacter mytili]|uniref:DNA-binding response regulator n=1 Tax=Malaciobacter mytili LMG 24559 TaxID=1032238 RepID=A0AAX2AJL0_9BACT|nr:response regulator transcription factor [Malaciobacter mytili]AXH13725.1 two-component system response regulator, putative CusR [Malaciobacter mytili LMG 24559]RXI42653.1 DNA-binding response regulator [Malaciobacter mytili]RXK16335.1 DNA-binding response regulator [Malaciobacter mytili LMG 24559]
MNILLLEDDLILNEIITEYLESKDYTVTSTYDGEDALINLFSNIYDLLLLDVNVPNINGFEILQRLRQEGITTPSIFITSLNQIDDLKKGFEIGCNDYIKKPFELEELGLRIDNIKKLFNIDTNIIKIDENIEFNTQDLILKNDGIIHHLPQKEAKILAYLVNHPNKIISHEELISNIWTYEETPSSSTLRTYIKNLRKILADEYIQTKKGVGYSFNKK